MESITLKSLAYISAINIKELYKIAQKHEIMQHIGLGTIWNMKKIKDYVTMEKQQIKKKLSKREWISYGIMLNNRKLIGYISLTKMVDNDVSKTKKFPQHILHKKSIKNMVKNRFSIRIFIDNIYQGRGFGSISLNSLIEQSKKIIPNIILISYIDSLNIPSINLHKKCGFEYNGMKKIGNKELTEYVYEK